MDLLGELENILMGHPEVREASVVGVPDEKWSERPLACVVRVDGSDVSASELRDHLAAHLAKWQLPERWAFVDEVPRRAWASSTRRSCAGATPTATSRSRRWSDPRVDSPADARR